MGAAERVNGGPASERVRLRRHADRAAYDRAVVDAILDEALVGHLGVVVDGQPVVLPTAIARDGDRVLLHGAPANRNLRSALAAGACLTVTLLDGFVLAGSHFNHSLNYRSAVILGTATPIDDPDEKRRALRLVVEHLVPGRATESREPTVKELAGTLVVAMRLDECSAKVRSGPPAAEADDPEGVWLGEVPLRTAAGAPAPIDGCEAPAPASVKALLERWHA